jgi:alpha-tubulin suppressor-like RCC1 family protein
MMKNILVCLIMGITMVANAQCWQMVSAGYNHSAAIKTDGTMWAWGDNSSGGLGTGAAPGTNLSTAVPVPVGTDTDWAWVGVKEGHTAALKNNGTIWAWGTNYYDQLGLGIDRDVNVPTQMGTDTNWATIICGESHMMAIKTDGTLWAWGNNYSGMLGDGTTILRDTPVQIGTDTDWATGACGTSHSVAIKTNGTLWAWGANPHGPDANGSDIHVLAPEQVGTDTDWQTVSAGSGVNVGLKTNGTLWTWGISSFGQLGNGTITDSFLVTPAQIGTDTWQYISASQYTIHAIKTDGTLWGWGNNQNFQIGIGASIDRSRPTQVPYGDTYRQISSGGSHTMAVRTDNSLSGWGHNDHGKIGNGSYQNAYVPVGVVCAALDVDTIVLNETVLYPNPATTTLGISGTYGLTPNNIILTDVTGKTILTQINTAQINVQQLPAGMYFIKITAGHNTYQDKFIKQ